MSKAESPDKSDTISIQTSKTSVTGDTEDLIKEEDPPKGCWHSFTKGVGGNYTANFSPIKSAGDPRAVKHTL